VEAAIDWNHIRAQQVSCNIAQQWIIKYELSVKHC
jgi:hypothetical protein